MEINNMENKHVIEVKDLSFFYGDNQVLKNVNLGINKNKVVALIGPSGCGKTTLLRCINRMHDLYKQNRYEGEILYNGEDILQKDNFIEIRSKLGMVFQKPTPFPMSIYDNIAYGLKLKGIKNKTEVANRVEDSLKKAALWNEVSDRLKSSAIGLSGGQQQRLVIARALAVEPDVLLFDEPTSALDPIATSKVEELIVELKNTVTVVVVTHNMQQAGRIADETAFMYIGELIEYDSTDIIFTNPKERLTEQYISGGFS